MSPFSFKYVGFSAPTAGFTYPAPILVVDDDDDDDDDGDDDDDNDDGDDDDNDDAFGFSSSCSTNNSSDSVTFSNISNVIFTFKNSLYRHA